VHGEWEAAAGVTDERWGSLYAIFMGQPDTPAPGSPEAYVLMVRRGVQQRVAAAGIQR